VRVVVPKTFVPGEGFTIANTFLSLHPWNSFWYASAHSWLSGRLMVEVLGRTVWVDVVLKSVDCAKGCNKCHLNAKQIFQNFAVEWPM
jgi:hypothetical protein